MNGKTENVVLWNDLSLGRARRLFAAGVLCAFVAFVGALLLAGQAHAQLSGDAIGGGAAGGGAQDLGGAGGGGISQNGGGQALGGTAGGGPSDSGAAANGGAGGSGGSGFGGGSLAPQGDQSLAPASNGSAPVTAPAPTHAPAPAQVYEVAPVAAAANELPASAGQAALPAVETVALVAWPVAATPETMLEPVTWAAEPVREVARPIGAVAPAVERVAAEPVRGAVERGIGPVTRPAKPPVVEPAVRTARLGGAPEVGRPSEVRIGPKAGPDAVPVYERVTDLLARPEPAESSPIAREAALLLSAALAAPEGTTISGFAKATSSGFSDLHGLLGPVVGGGEGSAVASAAVGVATGQSPPQPFGGVPAGAGASSGGLGAGSAVGGAGLAVLALLLFLLRAGGSLSWLSFEFPRPNSALIEITERPG